MKNRSLYSVLTRFGIIGAVLAALLFIASAAFADETVQHAENGTDPVATFSATDPEGDPITWKLEGSGVDNGKFDIGEDTGVLTFNDPPDFEMPGDGNETPDSAIATGAEDNMYQVSITANGGTPFLLTVEVTDEDEPGSVSLDKPQPQVGRDITASDLVDPDGGKDEISLAWFSGPTANGEWTALEFTKVTYTPKAADEGNYLRVLYTYNDKFGDGKTAEVVSDNPVEEKTLANARPQFTDDDAVPGTSAGQAGLQVERKSNEGAAVDSNVGDPISATDADNDVLRYEIVEDAANASPGTDDEKFTIDPKSGQLMVGTVLNFEPVGSVGATSEGNPDQIYVVNVRVVDPSGADAVAEVRIELQDVNEPPIFNKDSDGRTTVYVAENADASNNDDVFNASANAALSVDSGATYAPATDGGDGVTYLAEDEDGTADTITYSLEPTSQTAFAIVTDPEVGSVAVFTKVAATVVDFEKKDSYSLTVIAKSTRTVGSDAVDMYDSVAVTVKVVNTDDPGDVSFSQREPQVGSSLTASVDDVDGGVTNVAWQWYRMTEGDASTAAAAAAADVSEPSTSCPAADAADPIGSSSCVLEDATSASYTPTAADMGDADVRYLMARATYNDKFNDATKALSFGVTTADVQEASAANTAPEFKDQDLNIPGVQDETVTREIAENTGPETNVGDSFEAMDSNMDLLMYVIGGPDADSFQLSDPVVGGNTISLQTKAKLDYETKNEYTVTITAMDPSGATDLITVTVMVTGVDEGADVEGDDMVMFAENGEGAVATFTATDPEGDEIEWKLDDKGVDNGAFEIDEDTGVLTFKDSPNYESPTDKNEVDSVIAQGVEDNMYQVSVTANGGDPFLLTVEVTDEDEPGSVSLDKPQPQVGRPLMAMGFSDPDGANDESVAWFSGPTADGEWTDLEVTNDSYTPDVADEGNYLRVVYTYNDKFGVGKTAEAVSDNPVEEKTLANARPQFTDDDAVPGTSADQAGLQVGRESKEGAAKGSNIGDPISATDADEDILRYEIVKDAANASPGTDDEKFTIDPKSGQLMVGTVLNFEPVGSVGATSDGNPDQIYVVNVRVVDPSGADAVAEVRIELQDVNEPPIFDEDSDGRTTVYVAENADANNNDDVFNASANAALSVDSGATYAPATDGGDGVTYLAEDEDGTADTITYSIEGSTDFSIVTDPGVGSVAVFTKVAATVVDFEKKDSYSLTVIAKSTRTVGSDAVDMYDSVAVTVKVVNTDDDGTVSLTQREPQVGSSLTASVDDVDGDVSYVAWQWYRLTGVNALTAATNPAGFTLPTSPTDDCPAADAADPIGTISCVLDSATSASYTPTVADMGNPAEAGVGVRYLLARATYNDKFNDATKVNAQKVSDAAVEDANAANTAPEFKDQDRNVPGVQDETVTREIAENTGPETNVGDGFEATDDDGDRLMYVLGGPDADSFQLTDPERTSNSINLQTKAKLDFEMKNEYTVTITAMDPSGASDMVTVTVMVTNENDGATISIGPAENTAPAFADDAATDFMVYENMDAGAAVGTVTASDDDVGDTLTYSDDSGYFDVDGDGNITTTMMLDHEAMASHSVTITATDSEGATDTLDVTVAVGDAHPDCPDMGLTNDCEALLDAKGDLGGDLNWDADTAMADWEGVRMSDGRVSGIWLRDEGLDGSVSAALGRLDMLTVLNLHSNSLSGEIPDLSDASMLEELYLANNDLTGSIPASLNDLTNLTELWLWGNELTGGIPDLSALTSLDKLKLAGNMLDGNINAMYLPPNVTWLIIDSNGFDGVIPDLSGLTSLKLLWLHTNEFTGSVPDGTMLPASLDDLNLRDNMLMGRIPDLTALVNLTRLRLHNNSLSGAVPGSLGGLQSLKQLWLHNGTDDDGMLIGNNMFTSIEDGVGGLANTLIEIQLGGNNWDPDACVPAALADVDKNDYEAAGIAVCGANDGS